MTVSTVTVFSSITEGAYATPTYLNSKFTEVYDNLNALNAASALAIGSGYVYAHQQAGATWDAKITNAIAALPAAGGIVDARGLRGAQSMAANLIISLSNVTILCGTMICSAGTNRIIVSAGTNSVAILGESCWSATSDFASVTGTTFDYTGSGDFITVGTSSANTTFFRMADIGIQLHSSGATARGLVLVRCQIYMLDRLVIGGTSSANSRVGVVFDGTGNYCGSGTMSQCRITNLTTGILGTGVAVNNGMNDATFTGLKCSGLGIAVNVSVGQHAQFFGGDFESCTTAFSFSGGANAFGCVGYGVRMEGNTTDFSFAAGSTRNVFTITTGSNSGLPIITDSGSENRVTWASRNFVTTMFFGNTPSTTGTIALSNTGSIKAMNAAGSTDITLLDLDSANAIHIGSSGVGDITLANRLLWATDSGGAIGAGNAQRPSHLFLAGNSRVSGDCYISSGLSIGIGGTIIPAISSTSSLIAPFVVQGSSSSFTVVTWAAAKANDVIIVTPTSLNGNVSSLSSGIVLHSHCTQNGQVELRVSNCSTLAQNVSQRTYFFVRITPF
jgi:hypothetical protein